MTLTTKHQRLAALRPLSPESVASLAAAWDGRMVYESNSIEGNRLTLRETYLVISKGITIPGKKLEHHLEVKNLYDAWSALKKRAQQKDELQEADLLGCLNTLSGKNNVGLNGFMSSSAKAIALANGRPRKEPECMGDLFWILPDDPVERAAHLHHRITKHMRFDSSSGLIARLAMNFILLAAGYPPISISTDLRQAYYSALEAADSGDFPTWQNFLNTQLEQELDTWLEALQFSSTDH